MFLGFVGRSLPDDQPSVDNDPVASFESARQQMQVALNDPEVAATKYEGALGASILAQACRLFSCASASTCTDGTWRGPPV
jgi:hypothetical protein